MPPTVDKKPTQPEEQEKIWFQILAILSACLLSFTSGMFFSWTSPSIPKITEDRVNYNITLEEASYFTVLGPVGAMISVFIYPISLADLIGRKLTLLSTAFWYALSWILIATSTSVYLLYLARFISGIGDSIIFTVLAMYVGEVCTPKVRTTYGNVYSLSIYLGQLLINILTNLLPIATTAWIGLSVVLTFVGTFVFMPETPYFYLMKGKVEDARKSLRRLRRRHDVEEELMRLKSDVERQMLEKGHWKEIFTVAVNRRATLIAFFLRLSQQLSGIGCFLVYTQLIFIKAGTDIEPFTSTLITMVLIVCLNISAGFALDFVGRKKAFFYSVLFSGVMLLLLSIFFYLDEFQRSVDLSNYGWSPLAGMIMYIVFYSFGLGIVPTQMLGELFSTSIKIKALCVQTFLFGAMVSVCTKLFQLMVSHFGLFSPFFVFSINCFVSSCFSLYLVPETKDKTLEEIQAMLAKSDKKKELTKA